RDQGRHIRGRLCASGPRAGAAIKRVDGRAATSLCARLQRLWSVLCSLSVSAELVHPGGTRHGSASCSRFLVVASGIRRRDGI
ncbi:hypothetical protein A6R68_08746, partial [Neotoma lepida]